MSKQLTIKYASSLERLTSVNSSFDSGVLRVCYHGKNNNRTDIPKDVIEACIDTMYNCPIVCNYIRDEDEIGGHDVEIVRSSSGMHFVNLTTPVGVIPNGAKYWWEKIDDDGVKHEYLCVEALIWKRQEAYKKLKENGITEESMEITVKDGEMVDGYYRIYKFEFTAFCLLGKDSPCFESASVQLFSKSEFAHIYSQMMSDLKQELLNIQSAAGAAVDILHPQTYSEGGTEALDKKLELMAKYNLTAEILDFDINDFELDELEAKFKALAFSDDDGKGKASGDKGDDDDGDGTGDENADADKDDTDDATDEDKPKKNQNFSLTAEQFRSELIEALGTETYVASWGDEIPRYWYVDYDTEQSQVYCYDNSDWKLYGFTYTTEGDSVTVDFATKSRKKFSIVDFEDGDADISYSALYKSAKAHFSSMNAQKFADEKTELESKYTKLSKEVTELRKYKQDKLDEERNAAEVEIFAQFTDLAGTEAFEALVDSAKEYDLDMLEDKCFALRGRRVVQQMNFSANSKTPKIPASQRNDMKDEPYNGLFLKYKH